MKYLKCFEEIAQYRAFVNGEEFIIPSVYYIVEDKSVKYYALAPTKIFYIDNIECHFIDGMTWGEWIDSAYNTLGVYHDSGSGDIKNVLYDGNSIMSPTSTEVMHTIELIVENCRYTSIINGPGPGKV